MAEDGDGGGTVIKAQERVTGGTQTVIETK
jgi:hypothetical protein